MASEPQPAVDFGASVSDRIKSMPWKGPALQKQIEALVKKSGAKTLAALFDMVNFLSGADDQIVSLEDVPGIRDCKKEDRAPVVLAILLQNYQHAKNADRKQAVTDGTYVDIQTVDDADKYLGSLLSQCLTEKFRTAEKALVAEMSGGAQSRLAEKILTAPNHIYAAVMMKMEHLKFGKGDFRGILQVLHTKRSQKYLDIGRKLALLKTGVLLKKSEAFDIDQPADVSREEGVRVLSQEDIDAIPEAQKYVVFSDRKRYFKKNPVSMKHVFKVWATQVFPGASDLT